MLASAKPAQALVDVKINFQPDASATPSGYGKDIGLPFDAARGYGWVTEASLATGSHVGLDLRPNSRDRARAGIAPERNTLIQFQDPIVGGTRINTRGAWEYAVPAGTYKVFVSVGDQPPYDSHHFINVEGASVISNFVSSAANEFRADSVFVTVNDGRLTLDGIGGTNTKVNWISIASADGGGGSPGRIGIENLDVVPYPDRLVFNRINSGLTTHKFHEVAVLRVHNNGAGPLTLTGLDFTVAGKWSFPNNDQSLLPIVIAAGGSRDLPIKFIENTGSKGIREGELIIKSDDPAQAQTHVQLAGAYMLRPEGGNEVQAPDLLQAYGYKFSQVFAGQSLATPYLLTGEEISSLNWRRARPAFPVTVRQLTAFHTCCSAQVPFELVGTGGGSFRHLNTYGQSFLPLLSGSSGAPAGITLNPTDNFSFKIDGYTATQNPTGHAGVRTWPARDRSGALIPDAYYIIQDYVNAGASANYDFNDDVYLITNVQPIDNSLNPNIAGLYPGNPGLVLDFNQDYPGTLADGNGLTTGFTKTETNKVDRTNAPNSYAPGSLHKDIAAGTLTVATASGTNIGSDNTQVNGLVKAFDGRLTRFSVRATLLSPATLNVFGRQAGVTLGADRDDAIRLTAGVFTSGGVFSARFQQEFGGTVTTLSTTAINATGLQSLELVLLGTPAAGTVTAAYKAVYSGSQTALIALPGTITLTGVSYYKVFDRRSFGGIMAAHGAATPAQVVFDRFAVQSEAGNGTGTVRLVDVASANPYTAQDGRVWGPDAGLFTPANTAAESWGTPAIANTNDDVLYHTYRSLIPGNPPQDQRLLTFNIPVTSPANLLVKLHYAEVYWGAANGSPSKPGPGKRVFDIVVEGKTVLQDFDISAAAGGATNALVIPIENVQVNDGSLTISLKAKVDFGSLNALEVLKQ